LFTLLPFCMVSKTSNSTNSMSQKIRIHLEHIEYLNSNIPLTLFPRINFRNWKKPFQILVERHPHDQKAVTKAQVKVRSCKERKCRQQLFMNLNGIPQVNRASGISSLDQLYLEVGRVGLFFFGSSKLKLDFKKSIVWKCVKKEIGTSEFGRQSEPSR